MNTWAVPGYTESGELGSGASGRVVLAVHDGTGVPVAIKYLSERLRTNPVFVQGFRSEARLLGELASPHVVGLYEYVEGPRGAAIVMELIEGIALRALLRQEGATGPEAALAVLKGSLLGLADAHRAGVVHRDYKPENVLIAADGSSRLADFGIAAGLGSAPEVAGTPSYMAPEQWQGEPASPSADVYAATVTFYECLTGRKPFTGENIAELALEHLNAPVPVEGVPEPVRALVLRGLAKSPRERVRSAAVFVAELERIALAAYGPEWEERGRRRLAALAALLPLLFPSAGGEPASATDRAGTVFGRTAVAVGAWRALGGWLRPGAWTALPRRLRLALSASGPPLAALIVAVLLFSLVVAAEPDGGLSRTDARALTTTGARPDDGPGPEPTASPPASASAGTGSADPAPSRSAERSSGSRTPVTRPSASRTPRPGPAVPPAESGSPKPSSAAPSPSLSPSAPGPGPGPGTSPTERPTASASDSPSPTPSATPPVRVKSVTVSDLRRTRRGPGATVTIEVVTDGTGPVSVLVSWYTGRIAGEPGTLDGTEIFDRGGSRRYVLTPSHIFEGEGCYLAVRAATDPRAANGSPWQQIPWGCSDQ
ncbi:serine/threonine-protein kinase [Streptomyces inusitatus]|nr:serine/threonine-protein kinase [Streptomyces inusitatus]